MTRGISRARKERLAVQGWQGYSDEQMCQYAPGIRFAYILCGASFLLGLVLVNHYILGFTLVIAALGSFLPNHPFDYLWNYGVRFIFKKEKLPHRTKQANFACLIATFMIALTIYLFFIGQNIWAYVVGAVLLVSAALVGFLDICIPSIIYNYIFERKKA